MFIRNSSKDKHFHWCQKLRPLSLNFQMCPPRTCGFVLVYYNMLLSTFIDIIPQILTRFNILVGVRQEMS